MSMDDRLRALLGCKPGETLVECVERIRETLGCEENESVATALEDLVTRGKEAQERLRALGMHDA